MLVFLCSPLRFPFSPLTPCNITTICLTITLKIFFLMNYEADTVFSSDTQNHMSCVLDLRGFISGSSKCFESKSFYSNKKSSLSVENAAKSR